MLNVHRNRPFQNNDGPLTGKTVAVLALGVVALGGLASCGVLLDTVDGSGVAESVIYDFETVEEIEVGSAFNANITIEEGPPSVEIVIDDNLAQYLEVEEKNGRLDVGMESGSYDFNVGPELIVSTPRLDKLDASGAANAKVNGLDADRFELEVSGASSVEIEGNADQLKINLSGASSLAFQGTSDTVELDASGASSADLSQLSATTVEIDLSGASDAELGDVDTVTGEISGASSLEVDSDTDTSVDASGVSSIERR